MADSLAKRSRVLINYFPWESQEEAAQDLKKQKYRFCL